MTKRRPLPAKLDELEADLVKAIDRALRKYGYVVGASALSYTRDIKDGKHVDTPGTLSVDLDEMGADE